MTPGAAAGTTAAFSAAADRFAAELTKVFGLGVPAQLEDQLKAPIRDLLADVSAAFRLSVVAVTESSVTRLGARPDVGVTVGGLLNGHIELKAPGRGARPERFSGRDREQWQKFKSLPNLIYTDGSEWSLFRTGDLIQRVTLSGDVTRDGPAAYGMFGKDGLSRLLCDFFMWAPIVPSSPKALADLLAPLCRLLQQDALTAVTTPGTAISQLAEEWRGVLFPEADDQQFADAYAQTTLKL